MLLLTILLPILAGVIQTLAPLSRRARHWFCAAAILATDALGILSILLGRPMTLFPLTGTIPLAFGLDPVGRFFLVLVLAGYTAATFYAFEYLEHDDREHRFFAFWLASMGAMIAACLP